MGQHPLPPPEPPVAGKRLDSWKEIAAYLNRHVTTVRRWERHEALPVHRHLHEKLGSIYAYTGELDVWFESRRDDPDVPGSPVAVSPARSQRLPPPPSVAVAGSRVALVGRDEEMERLHQAWDLACRGQHQLVLVTGEPGTGKSRLTLEFARTVAKRATVLAGHCDREPIAPFAPFVSALQWLVRATPLEALRRRVADIDGRAELVQIVPEITRRLHLSEEFVSIAADSRRYRMFDACSELLVATSRDGPILLVVEDVQWADRGSLLLLRHLVRSMREAFICIVLTRRDNDPDCPDESRGILDDLCREYVAARIPLGALSQDHVRRVIQSWIGRPSPAWLTSLVFDHTEGNALFVTEMLEHFDETGGLAHLEDALAPVGPADLGLPRGIRELIGRRLHRLNPTTQKLLTLAAVVGREFRLSVVEALVEGGEDAVLDAMDEALAAGIVTELPGAPGHFAFTHALIRETLYNSITAARRVRLHHRIAGALERESSSATLRLGEVAYHYALAAVYKDADKAVQYALRAGDRASTALACEDAARYYEMALRAMDRLPDGPKSNERRFELHVKRGRSLFEVGQWTRAKSAYEAAVSLLDPCESARRCELLVRLAETAFWLMDIPALRMYASEAHRLAEHIGRDDLCGDALAWKASAQVADGDVSGGIETDRQAIRRAGGIVSFGLARAPLTLYWAGRVHEAVEYAAQAVERARGSDDPAFLLYALQHLGLALSGAGRYDESLQAFDEARSFGKRCGALPLLARATSMSVAPLLSLGDLDAALVRAFEARELAHRVAFEPPLVSAGIDLLLIFARLQDPGRAESLFDETAHAVRKAGGWHGWKWNMRLCQARAELALARGAWTEAIRAATSVIDQSRPRHRVKYEALGLATRARARRRIGARLAVEDARAAADVARRLRDPAVLVECLTILLDIDGSDAVLAEARATAQGMLPSLSQEPLRAAFLRSGVAKLGFQLKP